MDNADFHSDVSISDNEEVAIDPPRQDTLFRETTEGQRAWQQHTVTTPRYGVGHAASSSLPSAATYHPSPLAPWSVSHLACVAPPPSSTTLTQRQPVVPPPTESAALALRPPFVPPQVAAKACVIAATGAVSSSASKRNSRATQPPSAKRSAAATRDKARGSDPPPANWTVKDPGSTPVPTTNDYDAWDREQLRKKCTARKIPDEISVRRERLRENDMDRQQMLLEDDPEMQVPTDNLMTASCNVRLCNILVSDEFVDRLIRCEDQPRRLAIDAGEIGGKDIFWVDVATAFCENRTDYNALCTDDQRFAELRTDIIATHDSVQLRKAWFAVSALYKKAFDRSTQSGQHSDDFLSYCDGRLDVAYVRFCVNMKPQIASFVRERMPKGSQIDSTKPREQTPGKARAKNDRQDRQTQLDGEAIDLKQTLKALTAFVMQKPPTQPVAQVTPSKKTNDVRELLDCLAKSYAMLDQLEESRSKAESRGRATKHLDAAIELQTTGTRKLESEYQMAMGVERPRKIAHKEPKTGRGDNEQVNDGEGTNQGEEEVIIIV